MLSGKPKRDSLGSGLDDFDRKILERLQHNAAETNAELAEHIGLSPSPCLRRVHRLHEEGPIRRTVALLDPQAIGLRLNIFTIISLERQNEASLKAFESAVVDLPEVIECYLITGSDADYLLHMVLPDLPTYRQFLLDHITGIPGIARIRSSYALDQIKYTTSLPLKYAQ